MMNENVYFPMYLPQNCPVAQKMLITRFVQNLMFSFEETSLSGSLGRSGLNAPAEPSSRPAESKIYFFKRYIISLVQ